jgi:hypothetical protein
MKKLFTSAVLFVLAGVLLSSCSNTSGLSITKRHYRSGYYVNWGSKKQVPAVAKIPLMARHQGIPVISAKSETQVSTTGSTVASTKSGIVIKNEPSKKIQISENKIINSTSSSKNIFTVNADATNNVAESPGVNNRQTLSESNSGAGDAAAGAALSLLWIVIVVILILFLIGVLSGGWGLGGLLYLLLVIALVLLILWLLRIW